MQLLGDGQQACGGNLILAFRPQAGVLLVDCLADCRNTTLQDTLGDGTLCLGQFGQHGAAMLAAGLEALGLRALGQLGRSLEAGTALRTVAAGARATVGTGATRPIAGWARPTVGAGATSGAIAAGAAGTVAVTARAVATIATGPVATGAVATITASLRLDDSFEGLVAADHLEHAGLLRLGLALADREDAGAIHLRFSVCLQDHADYGALGKQRANEHAFGFLGTCSSPRPRAVWARAGELDFDPAGHGRPRYLL